MTTTPKTTEPTEAQRMAAMVIHWNKAQRNMLAALASKVAA